MRYRILADENIDRQVVDGLRAEGHDVEHVDDHESLQKGVRDETIAAHAIETDRVLLTNDDDFLREFAPDDRLPLLFLESDHLPSSTVVAIVDTISVTVPQSRIDRALYVSRNWL
ncbi:hypothetical protein GCM10028857_17070 [Salinarchaeum chitinilyticum]